MIDALISKEDELKPPANLNIGRREIRKLCNYIVGRKSFLVIIPQDSKLEFQQRLGEIMEKSIPEFAEQLGKPVQSIRVLDPLVPDFLEKFDELAENRKRFGEGSASAYREQFPELNVWFNPDGLYLDANKIPDFLHASKYAQNIFVFDHEFEFSDLPDELQRALGARTSTTIKL